MLPDLVQKGVYLSYTPAFTYKVDLKANVTV